MEHYNNVDRGIWWKEIMKLCFVSVLWRNHCNRESACCFWCVIGTIRVAVCNRIFPRSSWLVSDSKFAAKGGRRKKRRTKLREAEGEIFVTLPQPLSWLNEFTCLLIPLERWITSTLFGIVPVIPFICILIKYSAYSCSDRVGRFSVFSFDPWCDLLTVIIPRPEIFANNSIWIAYLFSSLIASNSVEDCLQTPIPMCSTSSMWCFMIRNGCGGYLVSVWQDSFKRTTFKWCWNCIVFVQFWDLFESLPLIIFGKEMHPASSEEEEWPEGECWC